MTSETDEFVYHELIAHVPMLVHPQPRRVLVIGGGDGGTVRELVKHPEVEEVVLCEIDGMVIEACQRYLPTIASQLTHAKVQVCVGDGVAYMAEEARDFDVIIVDSTDPVGPGEGLFTEAFYRNAYQALTEAGILVAQTESPFAAPDVIQKVYPMYRRIFPQVAMYTGVIPTYPGGLWTWAFCSRQYGPALPLHHHHRAQAIAQTCRYYNPAIHHAAFCLPNFVQALITSPVVAPIG
jgi:spermidine synthase